jgi:hypothetical protein
MIFTLTNPVASASASYVERNVPSATNTDRAHLPHTMPAFVSAEEAYFWTFAWQEGIREAMAEREAGNSRVFDSDDPDDVVRWLLSDDE